MKPLRIVPVAESDLEEIRTRSVEGWGISHWLKRAALLRDAFARIEQDHPVGQPRDDLVPGMRAVLVKPHIIFYREDGEYLVILRIVDGRRDLFSMEFEIE